MKTISKLADFESLSSDEQIHLVGALNPVDLNALSQSEDTSDHDDKSECFDDSKSHDHSTSHDIMTNTETSF